MLAGNRKPQGANLTVREEWGRPVRMAAMASLSTSMPAPYPRRSPSGGRRSDMEERFRDMDRLFPARLPSSA
ncbi:hypothetical protein GCM10010272_05840 [Streptomyces lateritius]|nr:hypothetical protein GCM10010272_05840 [Streptomyces lateritius]